MPTLDRSITTGSDDVEAEPAVSGFEPTFEQVWLGNSTAEGIFHGSFRFPNITVPAASTIDVAYITFEAVDDFGGGTEGTVSTNIYGVDEDNSAAPTTFAQWSTDHGLHTTAVVTWDFTKDRSGTVVTTSIVSIIQEIIDRGGWASGNAIQVHVDDDGSATDRYQEVAAVEHPSAAAAILHIEYTEAGGGGYLVHEEDGTSRFTLEDSSGFLILEETVGAVPSALPNRLKRLLDHPAIRM